MYHQNQISSTPNQNSDPHNWDIQNRLFSRHPSIEIPTKNPFMGINSFPNTNVFEGFQYNITNDLEFPMTYNTQFPVTSEGISYNMHDFQENTMCGYTAHNQGLIIGCHEPVHDVVESQQFNVSKSEGINLISQSKRVTKETINRRQDKKKDIIIKGQWTATEDEMLVKMVKRNGIKNWTSIAKMFQGRVGKQWHNHLGPDIKKNLWSEEEDRILIEVHKIIGNKWTEIAKRLPGRSENIKSDALPPRNNALENYISVNREVDSITTNSEIVTTKCENIVDEVMTLNMDATTCFYVPEQASLTWGYDFTKFHEPIDDTWMLMTGWN
ncbi:hypothetical protein ARALYDRAFT_330471 [Arabidopsis lyrata subsp. lyrata]|uniref:Myb family transcription factor n=1 Tax=Arabidopsis lyrata subsp. lyrata TaxID=81972 RepID=D7MJ98_ARALL|nr:hypothetical protein ARALYDRAFT_330471 [Arabidopsis lyrata subsp. lyrata]